MTLVDRIAPSLRWLLAAMGRDVTYTGDKGQTTATVRAYVRGVRSDDLFAAALQRDLAAVVDSQQFVNAIGALPQRFDRMRVAGASYSVEEWRGSPADAAPVFFKLLIRGGQQ